MYVYVSNGSFTNLLQVLGFFFFALLTVIQNKSFMFLCLTLFYKQLDLSDREMAPLMLNKTFLYFMWGLLVQSPFFVFGLNLLAGENFKHLHYLIWRFFNRRQRSSL